MQPIPTPFALDPDRVSHGEDLDPQAAAVNDALRESCAYAQQLWDELNAVRGYLRTASPTDPDDELAWRNWIEASSSVTSAMCGPYGDAGFGLEEAQHEARDRRAMAPRAPGTQQAPPLTQGPTPRPANRYKQAATVALVLLAIRGITPRR